MTKRPSKPVAVVTDPDTGKAIALVREFESASGVLIRYKQYRGDGPPPNDLGMPGDMFLDISPTHRLFIRYESWKEWPGMYKGSRLPFYHTTDHTKTVWCSPIDVTWYNRTSISMGKRTLFSHYPDVSFVSAHDLILRAGILSRWDSLSPALSNGSHGALTILDNNAAFDNSGIQNTNTSLPRCDTTPLSPLPFSAHHESNEVNPGSSESLVSSSPMRESLIPNTWQIASRLLAPHAELNNVQVISRHERTFESAKMQVIQYTLYHGLGCPSIDLGRAGDMFVDVTPKACRLFARYEHWKEWPGIYDEVGTHSDPLTNLFTHPQDVTRVVWCTQSEVMWYKNTSVRLGKIRLFSSKSYHGSSFISAHELIQRSGIPRRAGQKHLQSNDRDAVEGAANIKRSKVVTENATSIDSDDPSPIPHSEGAPLSAHILPPASPEILLSPVTLSRTSGSRDPYLTNESRDSSILSSAPDSENQIMPSSPAFESHLGPASPDNTSENPGTELDTDIKSDVGYSEAAKEARHTAKFREQYSKRKAKYWDRKTELARREAALSQQEEAIVEDVRCARRRLKEAKQNAIMRNEEAKRRDEELQRHRAEITALEQKVLLQQQALKKRQETIQKVQGSISLWQRV